MRPLHWVVGAGGLLGGAWTRALRARGDGVFAPAERFAWHDAARLHAQLDAAADAFAARVAAGQPWSVLWAAGVGSMGADERALAVETRSLARLLERLAHQPALARSPGRLVLASSAGAIYAGSGDATIDEDSPVAPTTPYALAKLEQEALIAHHVTERPNLHAFVARFSTLYGPAHALHKSQGLISHVARRIVRNQLVHIYVPYDTMRDYLHADDAAQLSLRSADAAAASPPAMRIVASQRPATIAEIVSTFRRLHRRPIRLVTSASRLSGLYSRRIVFRSRHDDVRAAEARNLSVGIGEVLQAEQRIFARAG